MKKIFFIILLCFSLVFCNSKKKSKDQQFKKELNTKTKQDTLKTTRFMSLDSSDFVYNKKSIDNSFWMPVDFVYNLNLKGFDDTSIRNNESYPYEFIHISNWKQKKIYANSSKFDYRKLRVVAINDSTYYLTKFNTHHYQNKDSIFLVKRKNQFSIITSKDSIHYCSNLKSFIFNDLFYYRLQRDVYFFKKTFDLYDSCNNLLESKIYFDILEKKIIGSDIFKTYSNTNYSTLANPKSESNKKYLIRLNEEEWYFYIKNNNLFLEKKDSLKYVLKRI